MSEPAPPATESRIEAARARAARERARQGLPERAEAALGVIGGSGLYAIDGLEDVVEALPGTPFGPPSDPIVVGTLSGRRVAFLARHGRGHRFLPSEVPYRANLWALRLLGVERVLAVSAVGSLREGIAPRDACIPDQLIDRTSGRPSTFFGEGIAAHVGIADPYCPDLSVRVVGLAESVFGAAGDGRSVHAGGTYVCIGGPQFSTRAESAVHRAWGADVVGMTGAPEAKLAREAELCYATLAFATDYDVWREGAEPVSVEQVIANLAVNVSAAREVIRRLAALPPWPRDRCPCPTALAGAIMTAPGARPPARLAELALLLGKGGGEPMAEETR